MDSNIEKVLRRDFGDDGYDLISRMLELMESGNKTDVRMKIARLVEDAADAEGVQTAEH